MLKKILIGLAVVVVILLIVFQVMKSKTKSASPEVKQTYSVGAAKVNLFYCEPSKKGRDIFGGIIKYGEVWRTGANEPTTFETDKNLVIDGKKLPAGKYSLWTIPQKDSWTVIFNKEIPYWGDNTDGKAARNANEDGRFCAPRKIHAATANFVATKLRGQPRRGAGFSPLQRPDCKSR